MTQRSNRQDLRPIQPAVNTGNSMPAAPTICGRLATLTVRQRDVAMLVAAGMTNRMIASHLGIAEWTVVNHLRQIMQRLECPSRLHVAIIVEREAPLNN